MCGPGMMEWAWQRNNVKKSAWKQAKKDFPNDFAVQQKAVNQKLVEFDGTRSEHDQLINTAIGGPGHPTL